MFNFDDDDFRGDVVQHLVVLKTTDETRSLLTTALGKTVENHKNDRNDRNDALKETVLMTTNHRKDSNVIDQV